MEDLKFNIPWPIKRATAYLLKFAARFIEEDNGCEFARELAFNAVERMVCSEYEFIDLLQKFSLDAFGKKYSDSDINHEIDSIYESLIVDYFRDLGFYSSNGFIPFCCSGISISNLALDIPIEFCIRQEYDDKWSIGLRIDPTISPEKITDQLFDTLLDASKFLFYYVKENGMLEKVIEWRKNYG
jgi:hypothetical protein